jgi:excisionase family DNA binding protein
VKLSDAPDVLTVVEVAAILRVNRDSAYELVRRGELQAVHIGRSVRVTRWALEAYLRGDGERGSP